MSKDVLTLAREAGLFTHKEVQPEIQRFAELVRADERNSWPAEMEAMERQVNILTDALAEQPAPAAPVQEPCGWQFFQDGKWHNGMETNNHRANTDAAGVPVRDVYPSPPAQQEPLTDEQLRVMCKQTWVFETVRQWARVIEAAHGIKENNT